MEIDENTDEIQEESVETESSSAKEYEPIEEDGFVSTLEFKEVDSDDDDDGGDTPEKQEKPDPEKKDFNDHPRFQELIKQRNEERQAREQLEARLAKLESQKQEKPKPKSKYSYKNIMDMDDEEVVDQFTNNPKQFLANYAQQLAHELTTDLQREQAAQMQQQQRQTESQRVLQSYQQFFEQNQDGIPLLQDGTIERFIQENPGHNPISAYHALVGDKRFESRLEEAVKKEREKIRKQLKAAGRAAPVKGDTGTRTYVDQTPAPAKNKADLKQAMLKRLLGSQ